MAFRVASAEDVFAQFGFAHERRAFLEKGGEESELFRGKRYRRIFRPQQAQPAALQREVALLKQAAAPVRAMELASDERQHLGIALAFLYKDVGLADLVAAYGLLGVAAEYQDGFGAQTRVGADEAADGSGGGLPSQVVIQQETVGEMAAGQLYGFGAVFCLVDRETFDAKEPGQDRKLNRIVFDYQYRVAHT